MRSGRFLPTMMLTALLAACGGTEPGGQSPGVSSAPVDGGTAVIAQLSDFDALNELVSTDYDTNQVLNFVLYMNLVNLDAEMNYEPYLADSFWMSDDGLELSFRIREGVTWHDGQPTTVDDVMWSYEMMADPELAYANAGYFTYVDRAERVDDRTVTFHFTEAHSDALMDFTEWGPMPKHLLEHIAPLDMRNAEFNRNPVGNGPFRFVSWAADQQAVFEAYPDFVFGRPHIDRLVIRTIPEQTTELTELLIGNLDLMRAVPPGEMARVDESQITKTIVYDSRAYTYLVWNTLNPLFSDPAIRRALTMAIDRQQIVDALLYGYGRLAAADVLPFQWEFNDAIEPYPYDPEEAVRILEAAGWVDTDGDGIRDKDGVPFRFELRTNKGNDLREDIVVIAQNDLREIGIDAGPRNLEWNTFIKELKLREFEAAVAGWSVDFKFNPTDLFSTAAIDGKYNYASYSNLRADELMAEALTTLDRAAAKPLWDEYQQIIHEEQPYTFLYYLQERLGVSRRLEGVVGDARGHLVSIADWWIPEQYQRIRGTPIASRTQDQGAAR